MMQDDARRCKMMQDDARQCKTMQGNARWCKMMQDDARWCKMMQDVLTLWGTFLVLAAAKKGAELFCPIESKCAGKHTQKVQITLEKFDNMKLDGSDARHFRARQRGPSWHWHVWTSTKIATSSLFSLHHIRSIYFFWFCLGCKLQRHLAGAEFGWEEN